MVIQEPADVYVADGWNYSDYSYTGRSGLYGQKSAEVIVSRHRIGRRAELYLQQGAWRLSRPAEKAANPDPERAWTELLRIGQNPRAANQYRAIGLHCFRSIMNLMNCRIPDRYVWWCERTVRELIPILLLDMLLINKELKCLEKNSEFGY